MAKDFVLGDVNLDGAVNSTDLGVLLNNFGWNWHSLRWSEGDLNADGTIDSTDLGQLLVNFGFETPSAGVSAFFPDVTEDEDED